MSKRSGIETKDFYPKQSHCANRRRMNHYSDENENPDKKRQLNGFNKRDDSESYPRSALLSEKECTNLRHGLTNDFDGNKQRKSMRGGKQSVEYMSHNKRQQTRVNMSLASSSSPLRMSPRDVSQVNNDNSQVKRDPTQTDIRSFMNQKRNSPKMNDFETPKKKSNIVCFEKKPKPLLSSKLNNTTNSSKKLFQTDDESENVITDSLTDDLNNYQLIDGMPILDIEDKLQVLDPQMPIGLKNLGNTCYMNSIVQAIFSLKFFIEDLQNKFDDMISICNEFSDNSMSKTLLNLYHEYNGLRNKSDNCSLVAIENSLSALKECVGQKWTSFNTFSQQDAAEFFTHIIDSIIEEFESVKEFPSDNNSIVRNFEFRTGRSLTCKKCKNKTTLKDEKFYTLYLSLPEDHCLQTAFVDFLKDETTAHQCVSPNCGANENILCKYFTKLSKVLFLQLGRYSEDGSKRTEEINVPQNIYLPLKYNNYGNIVKPIAPSPLATPYRSKLQSTYHTNIASPAVRKICFESSNCSENKQSLSLLNSSPTKPENVISNQDMKALDESEVCGQSDYNCLTPTKHQISTDSQLSQHMSTDDLSFEMEKSENYQLVAVICHHGSSLLGGHYSSYVYNIETSQWFQCDDNDISSTDYQTVQKESKSSGYCYFYVHI